MAEPLLLAVFVFVETGFSVIMAQLRLGIVVWFHFAVFWSGPGSLSKRSRSVSSVFSSRWWILFRRARRLAMADGGGLLTMAEEMMFAM